MSTTQMRASSVMNRLIEAGCEVLGAGTQDTIRLRAASHTRADKTHYVLDMNITAASVSAGVSDNLDSLTASARQGISTASAAALL